MSTPTPTPRQPVAAQTRAQLAARTDDLINLAARLSDVMEQEAGFLHRMDVPAIAALQPAKSAMAEAYERVVREISSSAEPLNAIDPARLAELRTTSERLDKAADNNAIALKTAAVANERMFHAIADAVRESRKQTATYGRDGRLAGGKSQRRAPAPAVSLNQTL